MLSEVNGLAVHGFVQWFYQTDLDAVKQLLAE